MTEKSGVTSFKSKKELMRRLSKNFMTLSCAVEEHFAEHSIRSRYENFFRQSLDYITSRNSFQNKMDTTNTPAATTPHQQPQTRPPAREHAFSRRSRRRRMNRLRKKHTTTSTLKSDTRETRGGTTPSRRSFSVTRPGCSENCGSAETSSRRSSMPSLTSRSSAAAADVSFSPTTNAFCFARLPHFFRPVLRTPFNSNSQLS